MIVQCPSCYTRYRTDSSHIVDETTRFQCTKDGCGHIFFYSPPLLEGVRQEPPTASSFFPEKEPIPALAPDDVFTIPTEDPTPQEEPVLTKPIEPLDKAPPEQSTIMEAFIPLDAPFYADAEAAERTFRDEARAPSTWSEPERTISPGSFLLFLGFLVFSFALLGIYCFYHPKNTEAMLSQLPVLNTLIAGERFSAQHIFLSDLNGRDLLTKDNQKVFAVSGTVTNTAPIPARTIQLEGVIYNEAGKILGQRMIFCGTNISPERLTNLTLREIGALQDLVPPKQFHVPAGETVNFLIVFPAPSSAVAEFSGRVVTAQFGS